MLHINKYILNTCQYLYMNLILYEKQIQYIKEFVLIGCTYLMKIQMYLKNLLGINVTNSLIAVLN